MNEKNNIESNLEFLKLTNLRENYIQMSEEAAGKQMSHLDFLASIIASEAEAKKQRASERRIKMAKFPVIKTIDNFQWSHPEKINRDQVRHLFKLEFVREFQNVIFLGGPGLGKSHLATALAYHACTKGYSVRFDTAVNVINRLDNAQKQGNFGSVMRSYITPQILCMDELGYLPIDQRGADLLFQVISSRYERGSIIITSNRQFSKWPLIFNNDKTITSAILDRILHHSNVVIIEGKSYRMKKAK